MRREPVTPREGHRFTIVVERRQLGKIYEAMGQHLTCACGWTCFIPTADSIHAATEGRTAPAKEAMDAHWSETEPPQHPDTIEERVRRAFASAMWAMGLCQGALESAGLFSPELREAIERAVACVNACRAPEGEAPPHE